MHVIHVDLDVSVCMTFHVLAYFNDFGWLIGSAHLLRRSVLFLNAQVCGIRSSYRRTLV